MRTIELSTPLSAPPEVVWDHVGRSALLHYVARGMLRFRPADPAGFPERWREGAYKTWMYWLGVVPLGWQMVRIEPAPAPAGGFAIRDNGAGPLVRRWDHVIEIAPAPGGALYTDRVTIDAGLLTPVVAWFAGRFYAHRQRRWRRLVANGFDYAV